MWRGSVGSIRLLDTAHVPRAEWEKHDPFNGNARDEAVMDMHNAANACSFFRTFQGWLSLTDTAPGEGSLKVRCMVTFFFSFVLGSPVLVGRPTVLPRSFAVIHRLACAPTGISAAAGVNRVLSASAVAARRAARHAVRCV
jgi:hypothetical protein